MSRHPFLLLSATLAILLGAALCVPSPAAAHPKDMTLTSIRVARTGVRVELVLPDRFLATPAPGAATSAPGEGTPAFRRATRVAEALAIRTGTGRCPLRGDPEAWRLPDIDAHRYVFVVDCGPAPERLFLHDALAAGAVDPGHENFVRYAVAGQEGRGVLTPRQSELEIPVAALVQPAGRPLDATWPAAETLAPDPLAFVGLGVEHVLEGTDHVLFVLGLFLVAMSWRRRLAVVTAFSVGHSLTLGLSALGVYSPTPWIAETAIAVSLVYLGLENLATLGGDGEPSGGNPGPLRRPSASRGGLVAILRGTAGRRWLVAGLFGLVHGFGFSYVLRDLGLPADRALGSLAGFNVGVELGQLVVLLLLAPALLAFGRFSGLRALRAVGSLAIGGIGFWWVVERSIG